MPEIKHEHTYTLRADFDRLISSVDTLARRFTGLTEASDKTEASVKQSSSALDRFSRGAQGAIGAANKAATAVLGAAAGFAAVAGRAAEANREISALSELSAISVESLSAIRVAALLTGQQLDDVVPDDFGERMLDAAQGGNEAAEGFRALGVEVRSSDGQLRDASIVLDEVITALQGIDNAAARAGLATLALGEEGRRLMTILGDSSIDDFRGIAEEFGFSTGPAAASAAADWSKATGEATLAMETLGQVIIDLVGPAATTFTENFALGIVHIASVLDEVTSSLEGTALIMRGLLQSDIRDGIDDITAGYEKLTSEANDLGGAFGRALQKTREFWEIQRSGSEFVGPTLDMLGKGAKNYADALKDPKDRLNQIASAQERLDQIARAAGDSQLSGIEAINAAYRDQLLVIFALGKAGGDTAGAIAAVQAAHEAEIAAFNEEIQSSFAMTEQMMTDLGEEAGAALASGFDEAADVISEKTEQLVADQREAAALMVESIISSVDSMAEGFAALVERQTEATASARDEEQAIFDERAQRIRDLRRMAEEAEKAGDSARAAELRDQADRTAARQQESKDTIKALDEKLKKQHQAALVAFRIEQGAAIASILANAAIMASSLGAAMALIPGGPAIAVGIATAFAAGQIASVVSREAPPAPESILHDGGMLAPDEFRFGGSVVRSGESSAILNQRATEQGALDVVDSLNRGLGQDAPVALVFEDAGEVIAKLWSREALAPSESGSDVRLQVRTLATGGA